MKAITITVASDGSFAISSATETIATRIGGDMANTSLSEAAYRIRRGVTWHPLNTPQVGFFRSDLLDAVVKILGCLEAEIGEDEETLARVMP
jgi:hypothetical protein